MLCSPDRGRIMNLPVAVEEDRAASLVTSVPHVSSMHSLSRIEAAVGELLAALGADLGREELRETPRRVASMYGELLAQEPFEVTTFPNDGGYDELVIVRDIPFASLCAHHLLPFTGRAHVGYIPGERIVGLSKLVRMVEHHSRGLQVQERLTREIADSVVHHLAPKGVGVVVEAEHGCMTIRGVRSHGASTVTSSLHGLLRESPSSREEFLKLAHGGDRWTG